jgi:hypothetical protein
VDGTLPFMTPMPAGGDRPGSSAPRPAALVVHPRPSSHLATATVLEAEGFDVTTCPGPMTATRCPARDGDTEMCDRLPKGLQLIVVDRASAAAGMQSAYRRWQPEAEIRLVDEAE